MLLNSAVNIVSGFNETSYSNTFDVSGETLFCNCFTFVNYVLKQNGLLIASKRACDLFFEVQKSDKFQIILNFDEIQAGDLILWKKNVVPSSGDSGHVGIIHKYRFPYLEIFDCVKEPHFNDKRGVSAIGFGDIKLIFNENSEYPKGFIWSKERKKTKFTEILFVRARMSHCNL